MLAPVSLRKVAYSTWAGWEASMAVGAPTRGAGAPVEVIKTTDRVAVGTTVVGAATPGVVAAAGMTMTAVGMTMTAMGMTMTAAMRMMEVGTRAETKIPGARRVTPSTAERTLDHDPGTVPCPLARASASVTGGLTGEGEGDDSGQERVILGGGTGGGEPGGDDTGREGPGIAGAVPTRQASPRTCTALRPGREPASVASDAAVKADTNPEAGNLAAAAGDLSVSKDQGGELADQAANEARG